MVMITDEELQSLTRAIQERYGLDFTQYEARSLKRGFARLIGRHQLVNLLGLWAKILREPDFFPSVVDELTVGLTEMFRNADFWVRMRDDVLSQLDSTRTLDIWHAGCSTGEELYSMAIALDDRGLLGRTRALATDLSRTALEQAQSGTYARQHLERYERAACAYRTRRPFAHYWDWSEQEGQIKMAYRRHLEFQPHNLVSDPMPRQFDLILCRNVMIYFDEQLKLRVLNLFRKSLRPGGFLVIGYYDLMPAAAHQFFGAYDAATRIYRPLAACAAAEVRPRFSA